MHSPSLSLSESNVLQDAQFFTTKAAIDAKINTLFGELKNKIEGSRAIVGDAHPGLWTTPGRMHRGEHLGDFPWRALDCPKSFQGKDILVFRTLLIWGNEFSFHFILSGEWLKVLGPNLSFEQLAADQWRLSLQTSPWDWSLNADSHTPLSHLAPEAWKTQIHTAEWLKLSQSLPLSKFDAVPEVGTRLWLNLAKAIHFLH
jgi:hypothetical protein